MSINSSGIRRGSEASDDHSIISVDEMDFENHGSQFRRSPANWVSAFTILVYALFTSFQFIALPFERNNVFSARVVSVALLFIFTYIENRITAYLYLRVRLDGYLAFFLATGRPRRAPLALMTIIFPCVVVVAVVMPEDWHNIHREVILQVLLCVNTLGVLIAKVYLIVLTRRHNLGREAPDVIRDEMRSLLPRKAAELKSTGGGNVDQVLQKQSETIKYLQEQREQLSFQLVTMSRKLRTYESGSGAPPEDLADLLAKKEQELRYLTAELDDAKARLSRAKIASP